MVKADVLFTSLVLLKVWDIINPKYIYLSNTVHIGKALKTKISLCKKKKNPVDFCEVCSTNLSLKQCPLSSL